MKGSNSISHTLRSIAVGTQEYSSVHAIGNIVAHINPHANQFPHTHTHTQPFPVTYIFVDQDNSSRATCDCEDNGQDAEKAMPGCQIHLPTRMAHYEGGKDTLLPKCVVS